MIDFDKTDFTYLHEMVDDLPKDDSNLQDPVSNKLQNLLGLKEWSKDRAGEGRQLEFGTDKYRQYTVDLTPEEKFELYYDEYCKRKDDDKSLDDVLTTLGITKPKKNKK